MKYDESLSLLEIVEAKIFRGDGVRSYDEIPPETICVNDLIVTSGRKFLAMRISGGDAAASAMAYMAVGTVTTAATLTDTTLTGEIKRKALSTSSNTSNDNIWVAVSTFGGSADAVTSLSIVEAGIFNHASSGLGTMFQRVTFSTVVLANSDLVKITLSTNVGSS